MAIEIRKMQPSDRAQVLKLLAYWNIAPVAPTPERPVSERAELVVDNAVVAVDGERIVGVCSFVQLSPTVAEGASLALDPAYQGRAIGNRLGMAVRRAMYARGIRTVRSESDRPETVRWLVGRGHRIVGTLPKRHPFGSPDVDHWTVLELDLGSLPELREPDPG